MGRRTLKVRAGFLFILFILAVGDGVLAVVVSSRQAGGSEVLWKDLTAGQAQSTWRNLGDWLESGEISLDPADDGLLVTSSGHGVLVNGRAGKTIDLLSRFEHGDVELHVEFLVPKGSNSGVYLQARYEIQIFDSWGVEKPKFSDCGGIYQRWVDDKGFEGHPPRTNASRQPGEWQSFDVIFRAPRFDERGRKVENARFVKVVHNGVAIHEDVEVTGPTRAGTFEDEAPVGPIMLQGDHGPVAFKNLRLRPLLLP